MNLDQLNKNQIVLLTLLISFITSIATGIVTVTLVDQAPVGVTQTINRVVEHTIERVVPTDTKPKTVPTPVIVTEENLIVKVINDGLPSVARVLVTADGQTSVAGLGFVVGDNGLVATLANLVPDHNKTYSLAFDNSLTLPASVVLTEPSGTLALLKLTDDGLKRAKDSKLTLTALKLSSTDSAVGQTVVSLGSIAGDSNAVSVGIISSLIKPTGDKADTDPIILHTNAATTDNLGAPLMNINGEVIGVSTGVGSAIGVRTLRLLLNSLK